MDITDETQKSRQKRKDTQLISTLRHFSQIRNGSVLRKARGCPSAATDDSWKIRNWIPDREEFVSLSLSQIPTVEEEELRGRRKEVSGSFFWETCVLCRLRKKRGERRGEQLNFFRFQTMIATTPTPFFLINYNLVLQLFQRSKYLFKSVFSITVKYICLKYDFFKLNFFHIFKIFNMIILKINIILLYF